MSNISVSNSQVATASQATTKKSDLKNDTKKQLEALGIEVTDDMTEAQAQQLIQQAQLEKNGNQQQNQQSTSDEIIADIKSLAGRVGVSYSNDDESDDILSKICDAISAKLDNATPAQADEISGYYEELVTLDTQYTAMMVNKQAMFKAMDQQAANNKLALGL